MWAGKTLYFVFIFYHMFISCCLRFCLSVVMRPYRDISPIDKERCLEDNLNFCGNKPGFKTKSEGETYCCKSENLKAAQRRSSSQGRGRPKGGKGRDMSYWLGGTEGDHPRFQVGRQPFICNICKEVFRQQRLLDWHVQIHFGSRVLFGCQMCDAVFTDKLYLVRHVRTAHNERSRQSFMCTACGLDCMTIARLEKHVRSEAGSGRFRCDTCCARFDHEVGLQVHRRSHANCGFFRCEACDAQFRHVGPLKRHLRIHTKALPCTTRAKTWSMWNTVLKVSKLRLVSIIICLFLQHFISRSK